MALYIYEIYSVLFYYQMIRMSYVRQDIKLEECFYAIVFSS